MADNDADQNDQQTADPKAALKRLGALVGAWDTEIVLPIDPSTVVRGRTDFAWLEEGPFLLQRGRVQHASFPVSTAIISGDDSNETTYSMLYSDSRGVSRLYSMSLTNETWKLWRAAPGFSQRFTGTFSADGNTITGAWEVSGDGSTWEHDFALTYTKLEGE